jgi:hypothetical protein
LVLVVLAAVPAAVLAPALELGAVAAAVVQLLSLSPLRLFPGLLQLPLAPALIRSARFVRLLLVLLELALPVVMRVVGQVAI